MVIVLKLFVLGHLSWNKKNRWEDNLAQTSKTVADLSVAIRQKVHVVGRGHASQEQDNFMFKRLYHEAWRPGYPNPNPL